MPRLPPPKLEPLPGGRFVVRDDLLVGGTKVRFLLPLLETYGAEEFVYAGPVYGYAQIALAEACRLLGKKATLFVAKRKEPHERTVRALRLGAEVRQVPAGYLSNVTAKARGYAEATGAVLLPFGVDSPIARSALVTAASELAFVPTEVWCVAGSGTLTRALQEAWPKAKHVAVRVGGKPNVGRADLYVAPEPFEKVAAVPPPFPSADNYDAKGWRFFRDFAAPGSVFWNVGS